MPNTGRNRPAARVARAVGAGAAGAATLAAGLAVFAGARFPVSYQFIASGLVGPRAYTSVRYGWMGVSLHVAVAVFWALAYTLLWARGGRGRRWLWGGAVLGAGAWAGMQAVLVVAGLTAGLGTGGAVAAAVAEHVGCYGVPVAWLLRKSD